MALIAFAARGMVVQSGWLAGMVHQAIVARLSEGLGRAVALGGIGGDLVRGIELRDFVVAERAGFSRGVVFSADRIRLAFDLPRLLLHPWDVMRSVARADLYSPRLVVARDHRGAWNIGDLLTPQRTPLGPQFRGRVVVHGGIVAYADAYGIPVPPFVTRFSHIDGMLDYRPGSQVFLQFSGRSVDGEDATVQGRYLPDSGIFDMDVTAQNGAVGHWGGYLVRLREIRWVAGRFDGRVHLLGTPSGVDLAVDYRGTVHLTDAEVEYLPTHLALRRIFGTMALDTDTASTEDLTLAVGGSQLAVRGEIAYPGGGRLDLALISPGLDLSTIRGLFFPTARIGLAGQASGSVWITGPLSMPYLDGDITSASGRLNREAFEALRTRFRYSGGTLTLSGLSAQVGGGRVAGDAVLDVSGATPEYLFTGEADDLDVNALPAAGAAVTDGLTGRVTGQVAGTGTGGRVQLMAGVRIGGGSVRGQRFQDLRALFWDDDGAVDLSFLRARVAGTTVYASGGVAKSGAVDLSVAALGVPLDGLSSRAGLQGLSAGGSADFDGRITGTSAAPVLSGAVTAWGGHVGPVPFAFARGDLTVSPQGIAFRSMSLEDGTAAYRISGGLRFALLTAVNLHLDAEGVPVATLLGGLSGAPPVSGTFSAHMSLNGPLAHPIGVGQVTLAGGSIAGQRVDRVAATLAADGRRVRIRSLDAQRGQARVHVAGTIDPAGPIDFTVSADRIGLSELSAVMGLSPAPRGTLRLEGAVHGTLRTPEITGTLRVPDLMFGGQAFDASGAITYRPGHLHVAPLALTQGAARYSLTGDLYVGTHPSAVLDLTIHNGQVATILGAAGLSLSPPAAGTINGSVQITGMLADPSAHLSLTLADARVGGMPFGTGIADITLRGGAIDIGRLELTPGQGQIAARGQVILGGTSSVEVAAHDLDPNLLRPFLRLETPLAGRLDFAMQWSGQTRNPTAGLSLEGTGIGLPGVTADRIIGLAYYKAGTVHIEDAMLVKGQHKALIQGSLPVAPGGWALDPRGPLALDVRLEDADMSLLSLLTRQVHDAHGTIEGEVSLGGTVGAPVMSGTVRSHGGRLRLDPIETPFEGIDVDIAFSQDQILVRTLSAALGAGRIEGGGTAGVSNFRPDHLALDLRARGATLTVPGLYAGGLDADLSLTGGADRPALSGTIALAHGRFAMGGGLEPGASSGLPPVALDISLVPAADVWYDDGPVRAELSGALHLGGTARQPTLSGTVRSLAGTVILLGTPFDLIEGQAVFSEALGFDPEISARGQALYGETRVFMDVNGVVPDATITWSADPPMSQADILGLVAGPPSSNTAISQGLGRLIFGSMGTALRHAFRLDELSLSYDPQNPVTLRIGKFVLRNVYLTVAQVFGRPLGTLVPVAGPGILTRLTTNQAYTVLSLEYFLNPTISLTYDADTLGDNGFFLLSRFPF